MSPFAQHIATGSHPLPSSLCVGLLVPNCSASAQRHLAGPVFQGQSFHSGRILTALWPWHRLILSSLQAHLQASQCPLTRHMEILGGRVHVLRVWYMWPNHVSHLLWSFTYPKSVCECRNEKWHLVQQKGNLKAGDMSGRERASQARGRVTVRGKGGDGWLRGRRARWAGLTP